MPIYRTSEDCREDFNSLYSHFKLGKRKLIGEKILNYCSIDKAKNRSVNIASTIDILSFEQKYFTSFENLSKISLLSKISINFSMMHLLIEDLERLGFKEI